MISYFIFFDEKTRYIFLQRPFFGRLPAAAPVFTYRLGYTAGGRNFCFWRKCTAGEQYQRDKQQSAFGYMVRHLYFYGQKDWPGR
jgi:hypothetical protein